MLSAVKRRQKSPAVVGSGRRRCAQGVEEDFIVAEEFQVLQARAAAQGQIGQGEHVVGFVVGEVDLQQLQTLVHGVDEAEPTGEGMNERRCRRWRGRGVRSAIS